MASTPAKQTAEHLLGRRARNAFYRPAFILQSLTLSSWLLWLFLKTPDRTLYHITGLPKWFMRLGQFASLLAMLRAARILQIPRVLGLPGLQAWFHHAPNIPPEPEAQGPPLRPDNQLDIRGPFRFSRHPLNLLPVPLIWLKPRMTLNWAILSTLATLYFYFGSAHEERRLLQRYGHPYRRYQQGPTPFFLPIPSTPVTTLPPQNHERIPAAHNPLSNLISPI